MISRLEKIAGYEISDDNHFLFANRTAGLKSSTIRELLALTQKPDIISFGGGLPAAESFPTREEFREITDKTIDRFGLSAILQYSETPGFRPLRENAVGYLQQLGVRVSSSEEVTVGTGSQETLSETAKLFLNPQDLVAVEAPTYMGALQAFSQYQARFVELETDNEGPVPFFLNYVLENFPIKFLYLVPTFQNPSGRTISFERRSEIAEILKKHHTVLLEDDPYSKLRYEENHLPPIQSLIPEQTIYTTTLSKVLGPGLRIGLTVAPPQIREKMILAKQGTNLHASTNNQALAAVYLGDGYLDRRLPQIISLYKSRKDKMLAALGKYFPASFSWTVPQGGLFIWVTGPENINTSNLLPQMLKEKVAYVPGAPFFALEGRGKNTMRLNFSYSSEDKIKQGIEIMGKVLSKI